MAINADNLRQWYNAQELVYASQTRADNQHIRLTVSQFSDFPTYEVVQRHVITMRRRQLYHGSSIEAAVRIYNEAASK